ncbi:class I SAM-dependent methyltransferase [Candidatus Gottesmanbacteria bacterium]|nr:class I SAM-dependent methyltransferase [Candidatus Gottesmanbacteria bacterium]
MDHASLTTLESMSQALWYNRWTLGAFAQYLKGHILEVGCGIGNFTPALSTFGHVWSIDIDSHATTHTKMKVSRHVKVGHGNIEQNTYFFKQRKFETIVCLNVLEHIKDDAKAMRNMANLLVPGGYLILLVPIHPFLFGSIDTAIGHYRRYTSSAVTKLLQQAGLSTVKKKKLNALGAIGWWMTGRLFRRRAVSDIQIRLFNLFSPILLPFENVIEPAWGTSILVIARKNKKI